MISHGPSIVRLGEYTNGYPFKPEDLGSKGLPVIRIAQLLDPKAECDRSTLTVPEVEVNDGDIVFSWSATLAVRIWDRGRALLNQHLFRVDPSPGVERRWLAYVLMVACDRLKGLMHGSAMTHVTKDMLRQVHVRLPAIAEQRATADFLDAETARIDALIAKKTRLLTVWGERLIESARSLTMVGERVPLRRLVGAVKTGTTPAASDLESLQAEAGVEWLSPGDLAEPLQVSEGGRQLSRDALDGGWVPRFPADSTLVVGIGATGRIAHLDREATGNQQLTCLVSGPLLLPRFLSWQLYSRQDELRFTAPWTTLPILTNEFIRSLSISLPPAGHQELIVEGLDSELRTFLSASDKLSRHIEVLRERRQALITAAVTGELEVPGVAA